MSSIDKLLIRGIRSFSPYQENVIEFYTPLTIIVGHNGAGKTTVIECLKYATTGDLPPNSKGGAFIHDPKVSKEVEVKGQIKLKFKNVRHQTMVCTRSLQSTQKKTKLEQKTLESLLSTKDPATGESVSISSRCAEMDAEIPLQLGVSRAVLENVLFCHQEESFWPLSEPGNLKKKFDDIFAATRYTKALDTLKSLRKDLSAELKLEQQKLDYLKSDKEKANRIKLDIEKSQAREVEGRKRIESIDLQLTKVDQSIQKLTEELNTINSLQNELERLLHDLENAKNNREDLVRGIKIMNQDDQSLSVMLADLSERNGREGTLLRDLEVEREQAEKDYLALNQHINQKMAEIGVFEAEFERINQKGRNKKKLIASLCVCLTTEIAADDVDALSKLKTLVQGRHNELERISIESKNSETILNSKIQDLSMKISSKSEIGKMKGKTLEDYRQKCSLIINNISDNSDAMHRIKILESDVIGKESVHRGLLQSFEALDYENRIQNLNIKSKDLESELRQLNLEISQFSRFSDTRARLAVKNTDFQQKMDTLNKLTVEIQSSHENLSAVSSEDLEKELEKMWRVKDRELKAVQDRQEKYSQIASVCKSKLDHSKSLLNKKENELTEKLKRIQTACGTEDFSMFYDEKEADYLTLTNELTSLLSSKETYEVFKKLFGSTHTCPLCERKFDSKSDEELFSHRIVSFLNELPSKTLDIQRKQQALAQKLDELKLLRSINDDTDRLKLTEIPDLVTESQRLSDEVTRSANDLEDVNSDLTTISTAERKLSSFRKRAEELGKLNREISLLSSEIESLSSQLGNSGNLLSLEDLQARISEKENERILVTKELESLSLEMKKRENELLESERRIGSIKDELLKLKLREADASRLESSRIEFESQIKLLEGEKLQLEQNVALLEAELMDLTSQKTSSDDEFQIKIKSLENNLKEIDPMLFRLNEIDQDIIVTQEKYNMKALEEHKIKLKSLEANHELFQSKRNEIFERINIQKKAASEAIVEERNIRDNIRLRELDNRIANLDTSLGNNQSKQNGSNKIVVSDHLQRQELCKSELLGERSGIFGELRQISDQSLRLNQELSTDFGRVEEEFSTQFIKFNATVTAIEDLEKYSKALDQAIMKFHSYKMAEVNRIIREIWTATYQGADIDTIEIRADAEGAIGGRSYNYRVVMCKGDTDLDMRGRSSAGQRVLTSLIIRLALAETFGQHCGVIALDEPTTNLDRENIESLANSLAEIIKMRGSQGNFQLIIITHDEEFVELLGRHECADYYWRVYKDENQYSIIERQSFQGA